MSYIRDRDTGYNEIPEQYLRDLRKSIPVSREEEIKLVARIRKGDEKARNHLITSNLRYVVVVAKGYKNRGLPLRDLISAGNIGLINALPRFNPKEGTRLISYANWYIRQAIYKALNEEVRLMRIPVNREELLRRISKLLQTEPELEGNLEAIAKRLDVNAKTVIDTVKISTSPLSLDHPVRAYDERNLEALLPDTSQPSPDVETLKNSLKDDLYAALESLDVREREILKLFFGLDGEPQTLEEVGFRFNLTRERIRQLKEIALGRLRHSGKTSRRLKTYL
jgi:RNA polymerase primary sigma factor